ncbi:MAG: aminotransferase class I/II-fold pyridoxal phosphate-dependent enzyme, partial [Acetivibrionales bacterium]
MFNSRLIEGLGKSSMIRAMFEDGERLRKQYGADKVYDFSLGNPDTEPPIEVAASLKKYVNSQEPGLHRYMSNAGYQDVRGKVAAYLQKKSGINLTAENIVMVCGAAAGLNIALKALLNPEDEVIVMSPFFVEYLSYIENAGGKPVIVKTLEDSFQIDLDAVDKAITAKTKAIILNSPNNPTGVVYTKDTLEGLKEVLEKKESELGTEIYVISDEPYISIVYDDVEVPNMMSIFNKSITVNSFS